MVESRNNEADFFREIIARANEGDAAAARLALESFAHAVDMHHYQANAANTALLNHVADCVRAYLDGAELAQAFRVRRPKKRPPDEPGIVERSVACAAAVELLMRRGFKKIAAVEAICEVTGRDRSTVMKDCRGWAGDGIDERKITQLALSVVRNRDFARLIKGSAR